MASSPRNSTDSPPPPESQTSTPQSLSKAVHARRSEYTCPQKLKVKIGSWNVAACPGTELDLGAWFVQGRGVDEHLSGVTISDTEIESVGAQEARRNKKESTVPRGDTGAAVTDGEEIGLYVLGLQEVVDLTSAREYVGRVYTDPGPTAKWRRALSSALPRGYELVAEQQLSGLLLLIFASSALAPTISATSTVSVGTGIMGYLGNKGAVTTRIVLGETTRMVFVNSHLASGSDPAHLERRIWDVQQILQRTQFDPISWGGVLDDAHEGIGQEDFAFWFGDLNFRLDGLPGDDIRRLLMLHTKGEYDIGLKSRNKIEGELANADGPIVIRSIDSDDESEESEHRTSSNFEQTDDSSISLPDPDDFVQHPSQDPASLQATLDSLLPHDQLKHVMRRKKAFHDGWREGPITFLPTYKYDVGSMGMFDSSEKKRAPSWCDRILFRTRRDKLEFDGKSQEEELARIKDEEMKSRGIDHAGDDEDVLFDYNPDEDGVEESLANTDYDENEEAEMEHPPVEVIAKEGYVDRIRLGTYTSHQRVLSSDHKPLDAVFLLEYDAVIPELKSKIQQEVARELDRAENEGRPGITIVVDLPQESEVVSQPDDSAPPPTSAVQGVDFGGVAYLRKKTRSLTIANTSQVPATFAFVDRPSVQGEGDWIAPPWLSVQFVGSETDEDERVAQALKREVTLEPGDAVNATLEVFVDDITQVRGLNEGTAQLEDILVLRVTEGRDHFIPVRANWKQSCFGRSIDELIRIPQGGVRALLPRPRGQIGGPINRGQEVCWSAPRELFKLTEAVEGLTERVIADSNMLSNSTIPRESPGWPFDADSWILQDEKAREERKEYVLEALDTDQNLNEAFPPEISAIERLEIMSEVLAAFVSSLTDGIVPSPLWATLESEIQSRGAKQLSDPEEIKMWVLDTLSTSPNHNISFVFLTSMLCRVAGELAPLPKSGLGNAGQESGMRKSIDTVRRSLSWKGKGPVVPEDPAIGRRKEVEKAWVDIWKMVFRAEVGRGSLKDKEKRVLEERRAYVLEPFLRGAKES
ncbi:Type I inositol polyphosphate 5-phosphatase [Lachnellula hyalina]|uniref:Type I inositol polyphosphate 5-phosphatase n=1 Tax=Lachnellula hyalina TaxID=1316788 RepID=A0A8H8R3B8_9HELO|nr:Type I inositol polyphosphate 5-phosphatase [Lachnellula hyalina]TVY27767.1 Type I inositol polyphosphate 5-phosphatase [Lachnellula hyalina]